MIIDAHRHLEKGFDFSQSVDGLLTAMNKLNSMEG